MKNPTSSQRGPAPKSTPPKVAANASSRPESKSQYALKSSAPADAHTLGRVTGTGWLK